MILSVLALLVLPVACYWPSRQGEFIYDDKGIDNYTQVTRGEWQAVWNRAGWRRLTWTSFAWNVWMVGPNKNGWTPRHFRWFHGVNQALHLLAVFLLWVIL